MCKVSPPLVQPLVHWAQVSGACGCLPTTCPQIASGVFHL